MGLYWNFIKISRFCEVVTAIYAHQHEPRAESQGVQDVSGSSRTLVLNATYEPLGVVSDRRALILVLNNRATAIEESDRILRYERGEVALPAVIRLHKFVRIPYRHTIPLSRRAIFARDGGRCVYCQATATSVDHVVPRSRGGVHHWENVVSCCQKCNHVKADKTLKELGWKLRTLPREPVGVAWRILGTSRAERSWIPYLEPYGVASASA
ncbi:MAG: HNH endonuclease [Actinobacteria bacterium]|nr:HNH endonuclease [Actinomycetota bacterium]